MRDAVLPAVTLVVGWLLAQITEVVRSRRDEAARAREHQVEHDRWMREQRAETYLDYLEVIHHLTDWLKQRIRGGEDELDDPYPGRALTRVECRVELYGSERVRELAASQWPVISDALTALLVDKDLEVAGGLFEVVMRIRNEIDAAMAADIQETRTAAG